jgi:hypothetical protein
MMIDLGSAMHASHSVKEREGLLLEAKVILDKAGDFRSRTRASLLAALSEEYSSTDIHKALSFSEESVSLYRRWPPSYDLENALYHEGLAHLYSDDFLEAERLFQEDISISKKLDGDPNSFLPRAYAFLGEAQDKQMRLSEAERSLREGLRAAKIFDGDAGIDTIETESRLGSVLLDMSRPGEALTYFQQARDACLRIKGADDPFYTPQMLLQYGMALDSFGRPEAALQAVSQAVENRRRNRPGTRYLGQMLEDQAAIFVEVGRLKEAEQNLAEAAAIRIKVSADKVNENYLIPRVNLALALNRPGDAAEVVERYYAGVADSPQPSYRMLNKLRAQAEIALLRNDAKTALSMAGHILAATSANPLSHYLATRRFQAMLFKGEAFLLSHNPSAAVPVLETALQGELQVYDLNSPQLAVTEAILGTAYLDLGNRFTAGQHLACARPILAIHPRLGPQYRRAFDALKTRLSAPG